jgi:Domain of unknown function (DUF1707)
MSEDALPQADFTELTARDSLRASHEDRDKVVEHLRMAGGDGRLDSDELGERVGAALSARTYGELAALVSDLPAAPGSPVAAVAAKPKDVIRIDCGSGHTRREGQWSVPRRMEVRVQSGGVRLDFTEALIAWPMLHIDADVGSGRLVLITRPGIVVDADDVSIRSGGVNVKAPWDAASFPVTLRIVVNGSVRSGRIRARLPRRSFWRWLTRGPRPYALPAGQPGGRAIG